MKKNKTNIIAEIGVNHNGDLILAKELIYAASEAKADTVKFQTFSSEAIATKKAKKAPYQRFNNKKKQNQLQMLKELEINSFFHHEIINLCSKLNID